MLLFTYLVASIYVSHRTQKPENRISYILLNVQSFFIFLFTIVWNSVNILIYLPEGKHKSPVGEGYSGEPQVVSHRVART